MREEADATHPEVFPPSGLPRQQPSCGSGAEAEEATETASSYARGTAGFYDAFHYGLGEASAEERTIQAFGR